VPTKRPPLSTKWCRLLRVDGVVWSAPGIPTAVNLRFLDRSRYSFFQVAPHLSTRDRMGPVPDSLRLRKSGSAGNRSRDLWISSLYLWPLGHWGGRPWYILIVNTVQCSLFLYKHWTQNRMLCLLEKQTSFGMKKNYMISGRILLLYQLRMLINGECSNCCVISLLSSP
jgi:hypothetical protein